MRFLRADRLTVVVVPNRGRRMVQYRRVEDASARSAGPRRQESKHMTPRRTTETPPRFKFDESYRLDVKEPSGLAYVPEMDRFVAIDDSSRALTTFVLKKHKLKSHVIESTRPRRDSVSDYEGIAYDSDRKRLIAVSERSGRIRVFGLVAGRGHGAESRLKQIGAGQLPRLGKTANKGVEGLAFLPAALAPDGRSHLVAVNEARPKAVLLIDPEVFEIRHRLALPGKWEKAIKDLSDVAVDPLSGHLFVLSDESRQILELELRVKDGELDLRKARRFDVEQKGTGKIDQPEGIAFDGDGDLYVTCEGSRCVYRYKRC
jgi:uncharacterized protein YjiK